MHHFAIRHRHTLLAGGLLIIALLLRRWSHQADVADLAFLLRPTATAISLFTDAPWTLVPDKGHAFTTLGMIIDRSCSGITFLITAWATFTFLLLRRAPSVRSGILGSAVAGLAAYLLTLTVNTGRILAMVMLDQQGLALGTKQHEAFGAFYFIGALLAACLLLDRTIRNHHTDAPIP